eukprot:scaffold195673_cov31-Tisochrysis_lutea.AAC.3
MSAARASGMSTAEGADDSITSAEGADVAVPPPVITAPSTVVAVTAATAASAVASVVVVHASPEGRAQRVSLVVTW